MSRRQTTEEFISKAKAIHGNKYDYSRVKYTRAKDKVEIICPKHGPFYQQAFNHTKGYGCKKCGDEQISIKNTKSFLDFVKKANRVHKHRYKYKEDGYEGHSKKVQIICDKHGIFKSIGANHLKGHGCRKCAHELQKIPNDLRERMLDSIVLKQTKKFLKNAPKVHDNKYGYENVDYKLATKKVEITCPIHGPFFQTPDSHINGHGCNKCAKDLSAVRQTKTLKKFLEDARKTHGETYSYKNVDYKKASTHIFITCKKHGDFKQTPNHHLQGKGCPKCVHKSEGRIAEILQKKEVTYREHRILNKKYDFFLPKYNLLIERDGEQHYRNNVKLFKDWQEDYLKKQQENDAYKTKLAKDNGFKIARLPYWLTAEEEEIEIENILAGKPTYPDVPDLAQENTKPRPKIEAQ